MIAVALNGPVKNQHQPLMVRHHHVQKKTYVTRAKKGSIRTYLCVKTEDASPVLWAECTKKHHLQLAKIILSVAKAIDMGHVTSKDAARALTERLKQCI